MSVKFSDSSVLSNLPVMGAAGRCATPKHEIPTKLDRSIAKKQAAAKDDRKLIAWARAVKKRDEWKDRLTGHPVKQVGGPNGVPVTDPDAGHAHHVEPRENPDTRYDVRNGITLSYTTHDAVERHTLRIVGTKFFRLKGRRYIDCTHPVKFVRVR